MGKTNLEIKDSSDINQSQNAKRRNSRFKKKNKMTSKSTCGWHSFWLMPDFSEAC